MGRKLYVGNLPFETTDADLQQMCERAGAVASVTIVRDTSTGRSRGFGFVEMATDDEARKAISELNDVSIAGRRLTVNEARPKSEGQSASRSRW